MKRRDDNDEEEKKEEEPVKPALTSLELANKSDENAKIGETNVNNSIDVDSKKSVGGSK